MNNPVFLKPNVMVEPLIRQWFAYWQLVPPHSAAMIVANSQLKIMKSFVAAPQAHVEAMKNPALMGGPFLNLDPSRVPDIQQLIAHTEKESAELLQLAEALKGLERVLVSETAGLGLESVYAKVPELLKGYVELKYDLQHRPSARFIEGLLYRSHFHRPEAQSVALSLVTGDERPFVYSTPRLAEPGSVVIEKPFSDEGFDALARMRSSAAPLGALQEQLGVKAQDAATFATYFTEQAPKPSPRFEGPGVRVRYFGHACILLESRGVSVLIDPGISYGYETTTPRFSFADLPERLDYVLITHAHSDHLSFETLLQLRPKIGTLVVPRSNGGGLADPSLRLVLQQLGFNRVRELDELESLEVEGGRILGLPFLGEHADLDIRSKLAYWVQLEGKSFLAAADSNALEPKLYDHIRESVGALDILFLGMESEGAPMSWGYGSLFTTPPSRKMDQARRLNGANFERAVEVVSRLKPKRIYNYAMGLEPWLGHVMALSYSESSPQMVDSKRFLEHCRALGLIAERPFCQMELML